MSGSVARGSVETPAARARGSEVVQNTPASVGLRTPYNAGRVPMSTPRRSSAAFDVSNSRGATPWSGARGRNDIGLAPRHLMNLPGAGTSSGVPAPSASFSVGAEVKSWVEGEGQGFKQWLKVLRWLDRRTAGERKGGARVGLANLGGLRLAVGLASICSERIWGRRVTAHPRRTTTARARCARWCGARTSTCARCSGSSRRLCATSARPPAPMTTARPSWRRSPSTSATCKTCAAPHALRRALNALQVAVAHATAPEQPPVLCAAA